jgi:GTP-binding protein HflX
LGDTRAFLFAVDSPSSVWPVADSLDELGKLAGTAGLHTVGRASQKRDTVHPGTYMGPGKLEELAFELADQNVDILLTDDELTPAQQRNIETRLREIQVVDRTALILDIFAQHARTREGHLQVELAQYEYLLPRLAGMWTHLERQAGGRRGGVGVRGPGETQLETDRRLVRRRLAILRRQIEEVRTQRQQHRDRRQQAGAPVVALVGYTNAGKSTLLNRLTNADVLAADQLFATLDPTTRRVRLPGGGVALMTDTVGFINKLPHELVAAFRATLEEIAEADVILHIVDSSHPLADTQKRTAELVLDDLGAPRDRIVTVWNKIDMVAEVEPSTNGALRISARTGAGIDALLGRIEDAVRGGMETIRHLISYRDGGLLRDIRTQGVLDIEEHRDEGTWVEAHVPPALAARVRSRAITSG